MATRKDTQRAEHISHDTCNGSLTRSRITREDVVLTLECIRFSTTDLQIEECSEVRYFLLDGCQSDHTVKLGQTLSIINCLGSLVRNVGRVDGHHLLVGQRRDINLLQTLGLLSDNLFEDLTHRSAVGEVFSTRVIKLGNHLKRQLLSLLREDIFLLLSEDTHNLVELVGRVVVDIEEIAETTTHTRIDTEQIVHLLTIAGSNDDELASVVLHTLHQLLQRLCSLLVLVTTLAQGCQRIGLVDKEDATHSLVAQTVDDFRCLTLIGTNHLRTVHLNYMTAIQIAYRLQNLTQLTGDGGLTGTWITCQHDMDARLLLFTQSALCTLYAVVNRKGYLADGLLDLVHTDITIQVA